LFDRYQSCAAAWFRALETELNTSFKNQYGGVARMRRADPDFYPLLENLSGIQQAGAVSLRVRKQKEGEALVMFFRKPSAVEHDDTIDEVKRVLGLQDETNQFHIIYGNTPGSANEIALLTRSILEILTDISAFVEVPPEHVAENRVIATMTSEGEGLRPPMIHIRYSESKPEDAFVAVPYHGAWFWIDDREHGSKKLFSFAISRCHLKESFRLD
jgi:hypothetical protein